MSLAHRQELPAGHVLLPDVIVGTLGVVLAYALGMVGFYLPVEREILARLEQWGYVGSGDLAALAPAVMFLLIAGAAYVTGFVILDASGYVRRVLWWVSAGVLSATLCPVLALYGIWYSPVPVVVAGAWSGCCALIYVASHRMPADDPESEDEEENDEAR